jgi:heterodisulfide reductase subunit A
MHWLRSLYRKMPKKVVDDVFEAGLGQRNNLHPLPQAVPKFPVLDQEKLHPFIKGACQTAKNSAQPVRLTSPSRMNSCQVDVGQIILATGWELFDVRRMPQYGYGKLPNVFTSLEFERLSNASGPTGGKIVMRDGVTSPSSVAIVHCVGSRDKNYNPYCSNICCMQSLKFAHLVHERTGAEVYNCYIDIRTYQRVMKSSISACEGNPLHPR